MKKIVLLTNVCTILSLPLRTYRFKKREVGGNNIILSTLLIENKLTKAVSVFFLAFVVGTMPCHACYDDDSDDEYEYDDYDWDDDDDDDDVVYGESTEYDIDYGELPEVICNGDDLSDESDDDIDWDYDDSSDDDLSIDDIIFEDDDLDDNNSYVGSYINEDTSNISGYNQFGKMYKMEDLEYLSKIGLVQICPNLPLEPPIQLYNNECVVDACAFLMSLELNLNFDMSRLEILSACENIGYNLTGNEPIPIVYSEIIIKTEILDINEYVYDCNTIENSIDNQHAILAIIPTGNYYYDNYVTITAEPVMHMVTIVGYDAFYYYCTVGDGYYTSILKTDFVKDSSIYTRNK